MDVNRESRSTSTFISIVTIALVIGAAADARAQARWDASVLTGFFVGRPPESVSNDFDHWYHTGVLGITAGRYLTPHLKLEGEAQLTGEGRRYVQRFVSVPGVGLYPVGSEEMVKMRAASVALTWQFLDNQALRQMAREIPLGTRVKAQTHGGRRVNGTLMSVTDEAVIIKKKTRLPEPAVTMPFADLARLERETNGGMNAGKIIGIGLAAGAGAILTLIAFFAALND